MKKNFEDAVSELELGKGNSYELVIILSEGYKGDKGWRKKAADWCAKCERDLDLAVAKAVKAVCVFDPENAADWLKEVTAPIRQKATNPMSVGWGLFNGGALGVLMSALWLDARGDDRYLTESSFSEKELAPILAEIAYFQVNFRSKGSSSATFSPSEDCLRLQSRIVKGFLYGGDWGGWKTRFKRVGEIYKATMLLMEQGPDKCLAAHLDYVPIGSMINDLTYPIFKRMTTYGRLKAINSLLDQAGAFTLYHTIA